MGKYIDYNKRKKNRSRMRCKRRSGINDEQNANVSDISVHDICNDENENTIDTVITYAQNEQNGSHTSTSFTYTNTGYQKPPLAPDKKANRKRANPDERDNTQYGHKQQQIDLCADKFYKKTKEGPIYCCISCKRALFRHSGLAFNTKRYSTNIHNVVFELLDRNDKKQTTLSTNGFVLHVIGH